MSVVENIIVLGNAPPPVHGQAVATEAVVNGDWKGAHVDFVRLNFSDSIGEVGFFRLRKFVVLSRILKDVRRLTKGDSNYALYFTPSVPGFFQLIRDWIILSFVRRRFKKIVHHFHSGGVADFLEGNLFLKFLGRRTFRKEDEVILISRCESRLAAVLGIERFTFVENGVSCPEGQVKRERGGSIFRIVYLGNLIRSKGIIDILQTARILAEKISHTDFELTLCGQWVSSEEQSEFEKLVKQFNLESSVTLSGEVHGEEKWRILSEANVFFFPSYYERENCPLVILEAMAMGLPVLTTNWRGIPELIEEGENGWLRDIRSPEQYAECLIGAIENPEKLVSMGEASRRIYASRFKQARFTEEVIEWILRSPAENLGSLEKISGNLVILGHFGGRNTGDEAMLSGFLTELELRLGRERVLQGLLVTKRPYEVGFLLKYPLIRQIKARFLPVLFSIRPRSTMVLCGGTHFHDDYRPVRLWRHYVYLGRLVCWFLWARAIRCRVELLGMGFGPISTTGGELLTRVALSFAHRVTVRDEASVAEVQRFSPSQVTGHYFDLAGNLKRPRNDDFSDKNGDIIGVSVTSLHESSPSTNDEWVEELGEVLLKRMEADSALRLRIFVFRGGVWDDDTAISARLKENIGEILASRVEICPFCDSPERTLQQISQCRYFFATRYHSAVLGYIGGCRIGLLAYHRKVEDFGRSCGIPSEGIVNVKNFVAQSEMESLADFVFKEDCEDVPERLWDSSQHLGDEMVAKFMQ